ncbi:hypothetical protein [Rhizobium sp. IBUN]|uniref:pPIWI-associating nuclease domain-containing protein n=1 Tax=Rhizobium sp. IBUN TaxID=1042326 RepID=UPI0004163FAF|nr:hypothetical protein [Rhizobium sp. IBUN]
MGKSDDIRSTVQFAIEAHWDALRRAIHLKDMEASGAGRTGSSRHSMLIMESCAEAAISASNEAVRVVLENDPTGAAAHEAMLLAEFGDIKTKVLRIFSREGRYHSGLGLEAALEETVAGAQENSILTLKLRAAARSEPAETHEDFGLAILGHFAKNRVAHKINVLGRPHQSGGLEAELGRRLETNERAKAASALEELLASRLLEPTYEDLSDPENWLRITEAGHEALRRGGTSELDLRLQSLGSQLQALRRGAWNALLDRREDATRQAAHSGRELISQVLHALAPDEEIRGKPGFTPAKDSRNGITRRMRIKHALAKREGGGSSSGDLIILERAGDLLEAIHDKLTGRAHSPNQSEAREVKLYLQTMETILEMLLSEPTFRK